MTRLRLNLCIHRQINVSTITAFGDIAARQSVLTSLLDSDVINVIYHFYFQRLRNDRGAIES